MFPVADGDTGDNMTQTLRAVMGSSTASTASRSTRSAASEVVAGRGPRRAARRARQQRRDPLPDRSRRGGGAVEPSRRAGRSGARVRGARARGGRRLLVGSRSGGGNDDHRRAGDVAPRGDRAGAGWRRRGWAHDASDAEQDRVLAEVLEKALEAAEASVERSPDLLPVLREHGVVDAGGYGVTLLVAGLIAGLRGEQPSVPDVPHYAPRRGPRRRGARIEPLPLLHQLHRQRRQPRGAARSCRRWRRSATRCSSWATSARCACTSTPTIPSGRSRSSRQRDGRAARRRGHARAGGPASRAPAPRRHAAARGPTVRCGIVAVAAGAGMRASTSSSVLTSWRAARRSTPAPSRSSPASTRSPRDEVIVLPNSSNVIMAADRAAELRRRPSWSSRRCGRRPALHAWWRTTRSGTLRPMREGLREALSVDRDRIRGARGSRRQAGAFPWRRGGRLRRRAACRMGRAAAGAHDGARATGRGPGAADALRG